MKHSVKTLSLLALLSATLTQANILDRNSFELNVGPTFNYAQFKFGERANNPQYLPKVQGYLAGVHFDFTYQHACHIFAKVRLDARWNAGNVAAIPNATFLGTDRFKVRDIRPEFDLGYTFAFGDCCSLEVTPFTGIGYIGFRRQARDTAPVNEFPILTYKELYVPVGVQVTWLKNNCFDVGVIAEYRIGVRNRLKRQQTSPAVLNETITLSRSQGFLVEVPLTWHHDTCYCWDWHTKIVPYVDWNRFGHRRSVDDPIDARMQSIYGGLHVDFGIHF